MLMCAYATAADAAAVTPLRSASMMEHSNNPDDDYTHDGTARILA